MLFHLFALDFIKNTQVSARKSHRRKWKSMQMTISTANTPAKRPFRRVFLRALLRRCDKRKAKNATDNKYKNPWNKCQVIIKTQEKKKIHRGKASKTKLEDSLV